VILNNSQTFKEYIARDRKFLVILNYAQEYKGEMPACVINWLKTMPCEENDFENKEESAKNLATLILVVPGLANKLLAGKQKNQKLKEFLETTLKEEDELLGKIRASCTLGKRGAEDLETPYSDGMCESDSATLSPDRQTYTM
jgi:hypothetical protein